MVEFQILAKNWKMMVTERLVTYAHKSQLNER